MTITKVTLIQTIIPQTNPAMTRMIVGSVAVIPACNHDALVKMKEQVIIIS